MSLVVCPKCHRHVKASEVACPFCAARTSARSTIGLALFVAGLGGSVIGCYGPPPRDEDFYDASPARADGGAGACADADAGAAVCDPGKP